MSQCLATPGPQGQCDIAIFAGVATQLAFFLTDPILGTPINLSAAAVQFTVKAGYGGASIVSTQTNAIGGHADPLNGRTVFQIPAQSLGALTRALTGVYEVRIVPQSGPAVIAMQGAFVITPAVGTS